MLDLFDKIKESAAFIQNEWKQQSTLVSSWGQDLGHWSNKYRLRLPSNTKGFLTFSSRPLRPIVDGGLWEVVWVKCDGYGRPISYV